MIYGLEKEQLYSQGKRQVQEEISKEKVKKKRTSGEAYDINKQTIHTDIALKSNIETESRVHCARSPHRAYTTQ